MYFQFSKFFSKAHFIFDSNLKAILAYWYDHLLRHAQFVIFFAGTMFYDNFLNQIIRVFKFTYLLTCLRIKLLNPID